MTDTENTVESINLGNDEDVPLTKQKGKVGRPKKIVVPKEKKPQSEKQKEVFKKALEARRANVEQRKLQKKIEASKLLLSLEQKEDKKPAPTPVEESSEEEEEEQEVKPIKAKKSKILPVKKEKKMKSKKIIIYQADSSDSDSESDDDEVESDHEPKHFKTQQNKKSLIKVYDKPQMHNPKPINTTKNYFVD
jgi:hypothetical protein